MKELRLYEIADELLAIIEADEFDEIKLNELTFAFEKKADGIVSFRESMDTFVDYCKAEEKRIADKRRAVENRSASLLKYLQDNMEHSNVMELKLGTRVLKIQNNPPAVIVDDESAIPAKYFVVIPETTKLDKNMLKADLKNGVVAGAHTEQSTRLVIK